jgi:hypothetical protein
MKKQRFEKLPKLTNIEIKPLIKENIEHVSFLNFNTFVLGLFLIFFVFFLMNCKEGGLFNGIDYNPIPYQMTK